MKTRNVVKALAVASLLTTNLHAQFRISGVVKNPSGKPLSGVAISIKGENKGAITTKDGSYAIMDVAPGSIQLIAQQFSYKRESKKLKLTSNQTVNFTLSPKVVMLDKFSVLGVRATKETPTTYTNIDRATIEQRNFGQDLPYLLQSTPSTVVTSDAGAGVGYTGYRIRGVDPTRINITINGIPTNDAESQGLFWVDLPDFASSVSSMQIQRGVGTSSNGGGAFGASINLKTGSFHRNAYATLDNSYGSFNTIKNTVKAGTGLLGGKFTLDARLSRIVSDGYIDRASSNLKSFYVEGGYHGKKSTLRFIVFSGKEKTYQAWNGVPESRVNGNREAMLQYASRNGLDSLETQRLLSSGRNYNTYTYKNQTDNYQQDYYQLHYRLKINNNWRLKTALFFTRGRGYYESFLKNEDFSSYDFQPLTVNGNAVTTQNMINQDWLDNYYGGGIFYINYHNHKNLDITLGGGINRYYGKHYEYLIWAQYMEDHKKTQKYYYNDANKVSGNAYLKANYKLGSFHLFGDLQYRYINYKFLGIDLYKGDIISFPETIDYHFFNPKIGITYQWSPNQSVYASYAVAHREPVRDDFRENLGGNRPSPESLYDLEIGYQWNKNKGKRNGGFFQATVYYMRYQNQLILTGEINDVGGYTRTNVDKSYRLGLELNGGYQPLKKLGFTGNLTLSQNKINDFVEYVDSYDASFNPIAQTTIDYGTTDMAFSPSIIGGLSINYAPFSGFLIRWMHKYVGKQFLDNTSSDSRSIDGFYISHLSVSYSFHAWFFKEIKIAGRINNLFNKMYSSNGYTFSYLVGNKRTQENFYYPQAGRNYMIRLVLKF